MNESQQRSERNLEIKENFHCPNSKLFNYYEQSETVEK